MILTHDEISFLDVYCHEGTEPPFGGPATDELARRNIYYPDLHGALTAYHREMTSRKILPFGKHNGNPPPSPWATRGDAERRNHALLEEYRVPEHAGPTTSE